MSDFIHYGDKGAVKLADVSAFYKSNHKQAILKMNADGFPVARDEITFRIVFEILGRKRTFWEFGTTASDKVERNIVFNRLLQAFSNHQDGLTGDNSSGDKQGLEWDGTVVKND